MTCKTLLSDLPTELLNQIATYSNANALSNLSQSSRALHNFVENEGWRTYSQHRFPSFHYPPYWKDVAHALTTVERNWQRRAFIAQYLEPAGDVTSVPTGQRVKKWKRPAGQTMGFQPSVDSYEQYIGSKWSHRREVVAWSAGAELIIRVRLRNQETDEAFRASSPRDRTEKYDASGRRVMWWTYRPFSSAEGRDDITSVKILRPAQPQSGGTTREDHILVGTASGDLQRLSIPVGAEGGVIKTYFVTNGAPVRSTSLSQDNDLLVANLADSKLALYNVDSGSSKIAPVSEIDAIPQAKRGCRIWSTKFLNPRQLAVGLGPSTEPVQIHEIRPEGFVKEPVRKLRSVGDGDNALGHARDSSVYPIEPLVDTNGDMGNGSVFLTGGYDGVISLHDLRSPRMYEATYQDGTDDAAIYSLLSRGRDRFVAGTSRHGLLKVFDLRMPGASKYDVADAAGADQGEAQMTGDWNVFINPRERYANSSWRGPNSWMRRSAEGSVYNLSSPSPTSPFIYVGVENAVVEFNFSSILDAHPDPIFARPQTITDDFGKLALNGAYKQQGVGAPTFFRHPDDVLNLAMYSQGTDGGKDSMQLRTQRNYLETLQQPQTLSGLDERWKVNH